jgi:outer membrane murein-binding lipoprotein Lpp
MSTLTRTFVCAALAASALAAGCASEGPRPVEQLTRARTLIDAADRGGSAQRYAAADLQRAHDELASANTADSAGKFNESRTYAESAAADANLAAARGAAGEAQHASHEVAQSNNSLRTEADRAADASSVMPAPPPPQPQQ